MDDRMNIGQAAEAAGVSAKMIRHYEQIGLLSPATRSDSGYRLYGRRDVSVLRFIRRSRRLGFPIRQIAELMGLWSDTQRSSREVKALASRHLAEIEQKMREMAAMKEELERVVDDCRGDDDPHCAILDGLALDGAAAPAAAPIIVDAATPRGTASPVGQGCGRCNGCGKPRGPAGLDASCGSCGE